MYRKYRSKKLEEIVGQSAVTTALNNALKSNQISHAYLFTGPRGVGKTSVARILAHEVNNLQYINGELPMDIIEIDAASNRRIEEIRNLREKVNIAPVSAKYKVYIIDEVHMLTKEAFNALLKTLEEPPAHVIFILATTEAHKIPETIISRTQRYNFKLATNEEVVGHLKTIASKENIIIDDESIAVIAKHSGGSMRDAISILDQIRHSADKINAKIVRQNIGVPSSSLLAGIIEAYKSDNPKNIFMSLSSIEDDGVSSNLLAAQLIDYIRESLVAKNQILPTEEAIILIRELMFVESSQRPDVQLEIALITAQLNRPVKSTNIISEARIENEEPNNSLSVPAQSLKSKLIINITKEETQNIEQAWPDILHNLRIKHSALYGVLKASVVDYGQINDNRLILSFSFPFHLKRMDEARNKQILNQSISDLGFGSFEIICMRKIQKKPIGTPSKAIINNASNNDIDNLKAIFGSAEVLE
ncbi:MAG: DNA polymerase III subunit gamma/tau [Candidatus Saccharibacteria bacterium]